MQKETQIDCPVNTWLNAKICLPEAQRGFALARLQTASAGRDEDDGADYQLTLCLDQGLIGEELQDDLLLRDRWQDNKETSEDVLLNLNQGATVLLAPPRAYGKSFWVARIRQVLNTGALQTAPEQANLKMITYSLLSLQEMKSFLESRREERVNFKTNVFLIDPQTYVSVQFLSYDISSSGLSLIVDNRSTEGKMPFEIGKEYLLEIQLHENLNLPPLNYKCLNVRHDIITGADLVGFQLQDAGAMKEEIAYNLTFLTWSGIPPYTAD